MSDDRVFSHRVLSVDAVSGPFVLCCEHASNAIAGVIDDALDDKESAFIEDHWGWDIGAARVTELLHGFLRAPAVLSGFSRLLIDPNRALDEDDLIVEEVEDHRLSFNRGLDDKMRRDRVDQLYRPYHRAIDEVLTETKSARNDLILVAIHSFTPVYLGERRPMEIGVLFDDFDDDARRITDELVAAGLNAVMNAPYSGRHGMMFSPWHHGKKHDVRYFELEIRQDLIAHEAGAQVMAEQLAVALRAIGDDDTH